MSNDTTPNTTPTTSTGSASKKPLPLQSIDITSYATTGVRTYITRPTLIEAVMFDNTPANIAILADFLGCTPVITIDNGKPVLHVTNPVNTCHCQINDFVVKVGGNFISCDQEVFIENHYPSINGNTHANLSIEAAEICSRVQSLREYINTPDYDSLTGKSQWAILSQLVHMENYWGNLKYRLKVGDCYENGTTSIADTSGVSPHSFDPEQPTDAQIEQLRQNAHPVGCFGSDTVPSNGKSTR